jgi:hypothetical protein
MFKKIAGIGLLVVSAFICLVLLMSGMLVLPHVLGPITLAIIGVVLLRN